MASLVEVTSDKIIIENHACVTARGTMEMYPERPLYVNITNFGRVVKLPKYQTWVKSQMHQFKWIILKTSVSSIPRRAPKQ